MVKTKKLARVLVAVCSGVLFSTGLLISGMCNPSNVIAFLDISGSWNPSLGLVMFGAILPNFLFYKLYISKNAEPILDTSFHLPSKKLLDSKLVIGSMLFGIGWGISGYCPGPALMSFGAMHAKGKILIFILSMISGVLIYAKLHEHKTRSV